MLDEAEIDILNRPLLRMWYKLGVNFADKNPIDRTDWQQVRIQASIAAMQGITSNPYFTQEFDRISKTVEQIRERAAIISVEFADALVKELKGE